MSLLLSADEKNRLACFSNFYYELVRLFNFFNGELKVNDMNVVACAVDLLFHLGVPS